MDKTEKHVVDAIISAKLELSELYFRIDLKSEKLCRNVKAGMFLNIDCGEGAVLRRPFAYMDVNGETLSVVIKKVGKGTSALSSCKVGDKLSILGPLGNSFPMPKEGKHAVLIAGGVGVPPIFFLAKSLHKNNTNYTVFLGADKMQNLILSEELAKLKGKLYSSTDDGSSGYHGNAVDCVRQNIADLCGNVIYACGPAPMLRAVKELAKDEGIEAYLSTESYMGCGYGVCLGCAVESAAGDGYKICCKDGPVFEAGEINI